MMDVSFGYKCNVCGSVFGAFVGGPPVHCGVPMVPAGAQAPRAAANVVCTNCNTSFGLVIGGERGKCPACNHTLS